MTGQSLSQSRYLMPTSPALEVFRAWNDCHILLIQGRRWAQLRAGKHSGNTNALEVTRTLHRLGHRGSWLKILRPYIAERRPGLVDMLDVFRSIKFRFRLA